MGLVICVGLPNPAPTKYVVVKELSVTYTVVAVSANEALVANELDTALEEDIILFKPNGPYTFDPVTNDAVAAVVVNELDTALEDDIAKEALNA